MRPGTILLYRGKEWLGNAIDFFESGEFCHVGLVYTEEKIIRQNPGGPGFELFKDAPWDSIVCGEINLMDYPGKPVHVPFYPQSDPEFFVEFQKACARHMGDTYDYSAIANFARQGKLKKFGLGFLANIARKIQIPFFTYRRNVCSSWAAIVIQETIRNAYNWQSFRFDPSIPESQERPCDIRTSPVFKLI